VTQPSEDLRREFGDLDIYLFDQLHCGRIVQGMTVLDAGCAGEGATSPVSSGADSTSGARIVTTAYAGGTYGLWNNSGLSQRCGTHPTVDGLTTADIELTPPGFNLLVGSRRRCPKPFPGFERLRPTWPWSTATVGTRRTFALGRNA